ncbi:MAG: hypothetical protein K2X07_05090 [Caulobacteraceae bacterium]|nr:hypothetical protein [Caulobacteraceae bacterium]
MTDQAAPDNQDDPTQRLRMLAAALLAEPGSDARAGLGHLVREIEAAQPGFIDRLSAVNDARRLGLWAHTTTQ